MTKKITNNPLQQAAIDKVMQIILNGGDDSNIEKLIETAGPGLAARFNFTVSHLCGLIAIVTPEGRDLDESKKSYSVMKRFFPEAEYLDDCVIGAWMFPDKIDTAAKLVETLAGKGFVLDKKNQEPGLIAAAGKNTKKNQQRPQH